MHFRQGQPTTDVDLAPWLVQTLPACKGRTEAARPLTNVQRTLNNAWAALRNGTSPPHVDFRDFGKLGMPRTSVGIKLETTYLARVRGLEA